MNEIKNNDILVSVIVPAFNRAGVLGRALRSALDQRVEAMEIIVVDDGSTDATAEVARAFGEPVRVISQANAGPAAARNRGVAASRGRWLAFLDSDDAWRPGKLEAQLRLLDEHPGSLMTVCSHRTRTHDGAWLDRPAAMPVDATDLQRQLLNNDAIATDCVVVARELFDRVGGFDASLHTAEDVQFYLACAAETEPVFDARVLAEVHLSGDGTVQRYGRETRIVSRIDVFCRCRSRLRDRRLRRCRRKALLREYLLLAALRLRLGRRAAALGAVAASLAWGLAVAQFKCALETLLGTRVYDGLSARLKGGRLS